MFGATRFGRLPVHRQGRTAALGASGFTVGEKRLDVVGRGLAGNLPDHDQQHSNRHAPTLK
jgi:hypothetical protein